MIYIVTGYMRSFTSMMMKCMEAGGLEAVYNVNRDKLNEIHGDEHYKVNAGGFYELDRMQYGEFGFPRMHNNKVIKVLFQGLKNMSVCEEGIKIVLMLRNPEEIRESYEAAFYAYQDSRMNRVNQICNNYVALMEEVVISMKNRKDVAGLTALWGPDVVENPLPEFEKLKDFGWPIDPIKAANIVDPKQHRIKV